MKKRNVMILVLLLVIGFATVSTTLILNGTVNIGANENEFIVIFTEVKLNGEKKNNFIDKATKRTITFETNKLTTLNEETILEYKVTNTSRLYDANVKIVCNFVDTEENIVESNDYIELMYDPDQMVIEAGKSKNGSVTAKLIKVSTEDQSVGIKCTLSANAIERNSLGEEYVPTNEWRITADNDNNGEISNGDLITLGTESFYVYNVEDEKVFALAQYNLYVGYIYDGSTVSLLENPTGLQDSRAVGYTKGYPHTATVPFHETSYVYETSDIKPYVDDYAKKLSELNDDIENVRLITKEELEAAGCNSNNRTCQGAPYYLYSTSYWTSTPYEPMPLDIWNVLTNGTFYYSYYIYYKNVCGVRPVVELSRALFN